MASLNLKSQMDLAKNIRIVEWLKAELLESVAALFKALLKTSDEAISDCLASIVISTYILGKRVGINFSYIDFKVESKLKLSINDIHEVETGFEDLKSLLVHLENKKK